MAMVLSNDFNLGLYIFQSARIIAKLACWGRIRLTHAEVLSYFEWLKGRLSAAVRFQFSTLFIYHACLTFYSLLVGGFEKNYETLHNIVVYILMTR